MSTALTVLIPPDEYLARPLIVSWLGYPTNSKLRLRSMHLIQQWAKNRLGRAMAGRNDNTFKDRIEGGLIQLDRMVDRQLLSSEMFRRQVFDGLLDVDPMFGNSSGTNFAKSLANRNRGGRGLTDYGSEHRRSWRDRETMFALGVGACVDWPPKEYSVQDWKDEPRPSIKSLLWTSRSWRSGPSTRASRLGNVRWLKAIPPHHV